MVHHDKPPSLTEKVAENSIAKIIARFVMPLVIAGLGYFIQDKLSSIERGQGTVWNEIRQIRNTQIEAKELIIVTRVKQEAHEKADEKTNADLIRLIQDHEARLRAKEGLPPH